MSGFGCEGRSEKVGVLLAQLGTPDDPTPRSLRKYLKQFLSDPRVIEANRALWWVILNGIILNTRPKRSSRLYKRIWTDEGSPLLLYTKRQTEMLQARLDARGAGVKVVFGMRYGTPSLESAIDELIASGCDRILLLPMYPQYAAATTASTYDAVFPHLLKNRYVPALKVAAPYYRHPAYLDAVASGINDALRASAEPPDRVLLSFHGIPRKYIEAGDPYCCMCTETAAALKPRLSIETSRIMQTYQSRFGKDPWLEPYTEVTLKELAESGVKRVMIAAPGFTADCLETIDELGTEGKEIFLEHGGEQYTLVPCLNDDRAWIDALETITVEELGTWLQPAKECGSCVQCPVKTFLAAANG